MEATYSVTELSQAIGHAVSRAFVDEVWVEGEIRDLSRARNGHVYFTLVDPGAPELAAVLPVTLFAPDREAVNRVLMRSGAMRMTDGVHVRIRGRVTHYAPRAAVQLRMTWIDTDYTIGKLAAARRALLAKLDAQGLLGRNAALPVPTVPMRIGLVTSVGSAAHADFMSELARSGYGFTVLVADARTQGAVAAETLAAALGSLASHGPDLVAVVRGGGAQTDLAAFDEESVAVAIATASFPVFTGIGHEIDESVADRVAARSYKTPTACAQAIVGLMAAFEETLRSLAGRVAAAGRGGAVLAARSVDTRSARLAGLARLHVLRHAGRLDATGAAIGRRAPEAAERALGRTLARALQARTAVRHRVERAAFDLDGAARRLMRSPVRALAAVERRLDALDAVQRSHDPQRLLERGWSLTFGPQERLVRNPAEVRGGDRLRTHTAGGSITSIVDAGGDGPDG